MKLFELLTPVSPSIRILRRYTECEAAPSFFLANLNKQNPTRNKRCGSVRAIRSSVYGMDIWAMQNLDSEISMQQSTNSAQQSSLVIVCYSSTHIWRPPPGSE